jgi:hypothetical protein
VENKGASGGAIGAQSIARGLIKMFCFAANGLINREDQGTMFDSSKMKMTLGKRDL